MAPGRQRFTPPVLAALYNQLAKTTANMYAKKIRVMSHRQLFYYIEKRPKIRTMTRPSIDDYIFFSTSLLEIDLLKRVPNRVEFLRGFVTRAIPRFPSCSLPAQPCSSISQPASALGSSRRHTKPWQIAETGAL